MSPSNHRLHSLDALRAGALLLGIVFHAAFSFFPGDQFWIITDTQRSDVISGAAYVLHIFRMTIFFLLAGYFGRMQLFRLGSGPFIRDRAKRIAIPLLVFWPVVMGCFIALGIWALVVGNGGVMPENPPQPPPLSLGTLPLTHLWFLYLLIILYGGLLLVRAALNALGIAEPLSQLSDWLVKTLAPLGLLTVLLALPTALALLSHPNWHVFFGIPTPEYGFVPNRAALIAYGTAFIVGWILQRQPDHLVSVVKPWPIYLLGAGVLSAYCLSVVGTQVTYVMPLAESARMSYAMAYTLAIWLWTFGLMGLCMKVWARESSIRRYLADASYWLYLIHLPLVMALHIWISQWTWPAEAKFLFVLGVALPLLIASYEFLVRYTFVGALLNGRKRSRQELNIAEAS